jgi:hypothetical protein
MSFRLSVCLSGSRSHGNLLAVPTGTCLPSLSHGNLFTEPIPRDPVSRSYGNLLADPTGTCQPVPREPSRSHGNLLAGPTGTCLSSRSHGILFTEPIPWEPVWTLGRYSSLADQLPVWTLGRLDFSLGSFPRTRCWANVVFV